MNITFTNKIKISINRDDLAKAMWENSRLKTKYIANESNCYRAITFRECKDYADTIIPKLYEIIKIEENKT